MTLHRIFPLSAGAAITYWMLSDTTEVFYDTPPLPMHGEMDPFFFLSQHKNFIPHEYPCRTKLIAELRDRRPVPMATDECLHKHLPFGQDRVERSGFWFRPTRIAARAQTLLKSEHAQEVLLRLTTCGGAIVRVQGQDVFWCAPYQRNLETSYEFSVCLKAGENPIEVYFDDLAERDARFFFTLTYVSGEPIFVCVPSTIAPALADDLEAMFNGLSFDKTAYFEGEIQLEFPKPAPCDLELIASVGGDFISQEPPTVFHRTLRKGERLLTLAEVTSVPADFRAFHFSLKIGDYQVSRTLGVEICHCEVQGDAPAALEARIEECLSHVAKKSEAGSVRALARLALGHKDALTEQMLENCLPSINECHDCADFTLVPLLWCRIRYGEEMSPLLRQKLDESILNFRYWLDEPGNDVQWYFSENHALLFHTAAYLAGNFFPHARFTRSGRLGSEQAEIGKTRLLAWLDHFEACEMAEWNSAPYFPIDLKGLSALVALAPDPEIALRAKNAVLRLLEIVARSMHQGMLTASQGRSYEHTLCAGRSLELSAISRLILAKGWYGARVHALPQMALLLRDHGFKVPDALQKIAIYQGDCPQEWRFTQGPNQIAKLYHYKTKHIAMGSIAAYRSGEWGYQETLLHLRVGNIPEAQVWINHPGEVAQSGFGRPSYWGGSGTLPRVHQYRGLAVVDFQTHPDQPAFTHAWLPKEVFQERLHEGTRLAFATGVPDDFSQGLLIGSSPLVFAHEGPARHTELRQEGTKTRWMVRLNDVNEHLSLAQFMAHFASLALRDEGDRFVVMDPDYGQIVFCADGTVYAEGRTLDPRAWHTQGETHLFPPHYSSFN